MNVRSQPRRCRFRSLAGVLTMTALVAFGLATWLPGGGAVHDGTIAAPHGARSTAASAGVALLDPRLPFHTATGPEQSSADLTAEAARLAAGGGPPGPGPQVGAVPALSTGWNQICSSCSPGGRYDAMMAYDAADGYVVLYGGYSASTYSILADTWTFRGGAWTLLSSSSTPGGLTYGSMAYDSADGWIVMFGGYTGSYQLTWSTWVFHAGTWYNRTSTPHPEPRYWGNMADDPADGYVVLFGGYNWYASGFLSSTWTFRAGAWTPQSSGNAPPGRYGGGMTFDAWDGYVLLYGGYGGTGFLSDTWSYLGGTWTAVGASPNPGARWVTNQLAFGQSAGMAILFGGYNYTGWLTDTWGYRAGTWTRLATTGATYRYEAVMSDDPTDCYVALGFGYPGTADTWGWYNPIPIAARGFLSPATTDAGLPVHFLGVPLGACAPYSTLWRFGDGSSSTSAATTHTFPTPGNYTVWFWANATFGGGPVSATWTTVVQVNPYPTLVAQVFPSVTDAGWPVILGAAGTGGTAPLVYTWRFGDGGWSYQSDPVHVYAQPGTYTARAWLNDSAGASVNQSVTATINPALNNPPATASPAKTDVGQTVSFSGNPAGGTPPYIQTFTFGDGANAPGPTAAHVYTTPGSFSAYYWVNDSAHVTAWTLMPVVIHPTPTITSFVASRNPVDLGGGVILAVSVAGGTAPFTYAYTGLPSGCASVNASELPCQPQSIQMASVQVTVTDVVGVSVSQVLQLNVVPDPTVATFTATPPVLSVGGTVDLAATVSGGAPPYVGTWLGLPSGCLASVVLEFSCIPREPGTFAIEITVLDAQGMRTFANTTLTVNPAPEITSFVVSPSNPVAGERVQFWTNATGGTGFLSYSYTGLPSGCSGGNRSTFTCNPSRSGPYTVNVEVTDVNGRSANASTQLVVTDTSLVAGSASGGNLVLLAIGGLAVVAALVAAVLFLGLRPRRRASEPSSSK